MNLIKFVRIFLLVLIIVGLGLLVTQKIWVPKVVNQILSYENTNGGLKVSPTKDSFDWCIESGGKDFTPSYNTPKTCILDNKIYRNKCVENDKYFVVEKSLSDSAGSDHLIKFKTNSNQTFECQYVANNGDLEIKNESAEYIMALENNLLLLDSGTGPQNRKMIVYDLIKKSIVFTDSYNTMEENNLDITNAYAKYWTSTNKKVTSVNCPKANEYKANGLGAIINARIILDLKTLTKKETGETQCLATQ